MLKKCLSLEEPANRVMTGFEHVKLVLYIGVPTPDAALEKML